MKKSIAVQTCSDTKTKETEIDFKLFILFIEELNEKTLGLDEWGDKVFGFIHLMLDKYRFVNAQQVQNDNATFWWNVYDVVGSVHYSPNLKTERALHHATASERNKALLIDLKLV
ncbi:MAG: hypothetical protein ABIP51_20105 [Bacteroidia bacterium]